METQHRAGTFKVSCKTVCELFVQLNSFNCETNGVRHGAADGVVPERVALCTEQLTDSEGVHIYSWILGRPDRN